MIASMLALLLSVAGQAGASQAAAPQAVPPVPGELGRQPLPAQGCAAYLWNVSDRKLVAMAGADPALVRLVLGGKAIDLARASESGLGGFGFAARTAYRNSDVAVTLDMTVQTQAELTDGGAVPQGTLTVERGGTDAVVIPVAGLIGCAPAR
ncbi:hypothetical protein ASG67_07735 [Sphingomonas sp. Leaf339]|uniref:hypothetical protein n=1 Tax=Sphingomonas sp. Leaf339 TaxID=1736343 RepID=UPI0006FADB6D|nr:hypothetical protein [Sphingomonas sp. Leaf339]KQU55968.1 hypothetical protein ASG67_07735 [Sphingomonas sp. Leaf339]